MTQKLINFLNIFQVFNKSILIFLLLVIGVWFRLANYLSGDNFVDLLKATVISYFGTHALQHFTSMVKDHLASKTSTEGNSDDIEAISVVNDEQKGEKDNG